MSSHYRWGGGKSFDERDNRHHQHDSINNGGDWQSSDTRRRRSRSRSKEADRPWIRGEALAAEMPQGPTSAILIRNLTPRTDERMIGAALSAYYPTGIRLLTHPETGEVRCQAHVNFHSAEYTTALIGAYGGSAGHAGQPHFTIDNRTVSIEYSSPNGPPVDPPLSSRREHREGGRHRNNDRERSRSQDRERGGDRERRSRSRDRDRDRERRDRPKEERGDSGSSTNSGENQQQARQGRAKVKESDWVCGKCHKLNYGRRNDCCGCKEPKGADSIFLGPGPDGPGGGRTPADESDIPRTTLILKGLAFHSNEASVIEAITAMGIVIKDCKLVRDRNTSASRGFCFLDLHDLKSAEYIVLQAIKNSQCNGIQIEGRLVRVAYATDSFHALTGPSSDLIPAALGGLQQEAQIIQGEMDAAAAAANLLAKTKPEWPPIFEEAGAAYVMDGTTGYFWEGASAFYYDPASRLYYSTLKQSYFFHNATFDPPFQRFDPPSPPPPLSQEGMAAAVGAAGGYASVPGASGYAAAAGPAAGYASNSSGTNDYSSYYANQGPFSGQGGQAAAAAAAKTVSITLKPKSGKAAGGLGASSGKARGVSGDDGTWAAEEAHDEEEERKRVAQEQQQQQEEANKASQEQEKRGGGTSNFLPTLSNDALLSTLSGGGGGLGAAVSAEEASFKGQEARGEPVCLLCRRAFDSMEQLAKHEAKSKLHAENLAKAKAEGTLPSEQRQQPQYRDRASERRQFYGQDDRPKSLWEEERRARAQRNGGEEEHRKGGGGGSGSRSSHYPPAPAVPQTAQDKPLDDDNIGSQMLKNLGWKQGEGLGRDGSGIKEPVRADQAQKDLDKGGVGVRSGGGKVGEFTATYFDSANAKEAHQAIARARYDRLQEQQYHQQSR